MKARDLFLAMLLAFGGKLGGKTVIQKIGYFLSLLHPTSLRYSPHFYGPYSAQLDDAIKQCKALGFVTETSTGLGFSTRGFEVRRYDYTITDDGKAIAQAVSAVNPDECKAIIDAIERIRHCGELDSFQFAIAAKTVHVLRDARVPMDKQSIAEYAQGFGWTMNPKDIEQVIDFLTCMGLVAEAH